MLVALKGPSCVVQLLLLTEAGRKKFKTLQIKIVDWVRPLMDGYSSGSIMLELKFLKNEMNFLAGGNVISIGRNVAEDVNMFCRSGWRKEFDFEGGELFWLGEYRSLFQCSTRNTLSRKILELKHRTEPAVEFFLAALEKLEFKPGYDLAVVPGHIKGSGDRHSRCGESGVSLLGKRWAVASGLGDATNCLMRKAGVSKLSCGGSRALKVHLDSIALNQQVAGKSIILLDDVFVTGNSMRACKRILLEGGAANVICVALGKVPLYYEGLITEPECSTGVAHVQSIRSEGVVFIVATGTGVD
ncbi:MAG: phosphoribosyltransferase [Terriglobales bacterium]